MPPQNAKRVKNVSVSRPILIGNTARPLLDSERKEDTPVDHTHQWTIFVRDPSFPDGSQSKQGEKGDISYFIKKVVYKLHDTYPQPSRSIESPPFELVETGWGEFEILVRIFFVSESGEKNVQTYHHLKLHPYGQNADPNVPQPVESYIYEELVFNEPTEAMLLALCSKPGSGSIPAKKTDKIKYCAQTETEELEKLSSGLENVYNQVQKMREHLKSLEKQKEALE